MKMQRKKGFFSISAVAKMFSIHQQTIRLYEKEGLIIPERSEGNTRLFSEQDVQRLEEIIYLTHELGINLAGVEMIFKLKKQIHKMQKEMNKVFENAQTELDKETETSKTVIKASAQKLMNMKKAQQKKEKPIEPSDVTIHTESSSIDLDVDDWQVDYED